MSPELIGLLSVAAIVVLIYTGVHVAVALALCSFVGVWLIRGRFDIATNMLASSANEAISDYVFGVIPLFVMMGLAVSVSGIGLDTFTAANRFFGRMRGGLGVATVAANAVFAAITGISIASAAVFGRVAVPEMIRLGYDRRFAVGIVAGSSILGMLIPPSLLLIIYSILAEQSVGDMFLAAVVPGLVMSAAFALGIVIMATLRPALTRAGTGDAGAEVALISWSQAMAKLAPILLLVLLVLGGIYGGFFTPTEAGAVGALAALILAVLRGTITRRSGWRLLSETGHVTAAVCLLIITAAMYSRMLALSGLPNAIGDFFAASGLEGLELLLVYLGIIIVLGTILDSISILLIMVPLVLPILRADGMDLVWIGILTVVAVEIGIITPPLGIGVFVVKSAIDREDISLGDVFRGAFPFVLMMVAVLALLVAVPSLSTVFTG